MNPLRKIIVDSFDLEERINFLAVLFSVARSDNVSYSERDRLAPVADWLGSSESELNDAMKRAYDPELSLFQLAGGLKSGDKGLLLFRECCAVVWVDFTKTEDESLILDELSRILGLSDETRAVLDSPLACSPEGERRFLVLLGED